MSKLARSRPTRSRARGESLGERVEAAATIAAIYEKRGQKVPEAIEAILSVPETALDSDRIAKEDELAIADEVRNAIEEANQKAELKAAERALKAANIAEAFMNGAHVTVYSSRVSVNSHATLAKLDRDKIQYEEVSIEDDADARDYVMALGYFHTPVVVVGDHHWAGFQPDYLDALSLPNAQKDRPGIA